jgi:peptidoglycan/LPS O-acetylase OafA/YrhL
LLGSALPSQLIFTTVCIGMTVGLAALSWRFYEQPILGLKRFFPAGPRRAASTEAKAVEGLGTAA